MTCNPGKNADDLDAVACEIEVHDYLVGLSVAGTLHRIEAVCGPVARTVCAELKDFGAPPEEE